MYLSSAFSPLWSILFYETTFCVAYVFSYASKANFCHWKLLLGFVPRSVLFLATEAQALLHQTGGFSARGADFLFFFKIVFV